MAKQAGLSLKLKRESVIKRNESLTYSISVVSVFCQVSQLTASVIVCDCNYTLCVAPLQKKVFNVDLRFMLLYYQSAVFLHVAFAISLSCIAGFFLFYSACIFYCSISARGAFCIVL